MLVAGSRVGVVIGPVLIVARTGFRRRWGSLAGVALLVAVFSAAVLVALVGAHRTATSLDRFREWSRSSDVDFQGDTVEWSQEMQRTLDGDPAVGATALRYLVNAFPVGDAAGLADLAILSDPAGDFGVTVDRVRVLDGRMPSADAPAEVIVNEVASELLGVGPGDSLRVATWSAEDLVAIGTGGDFPGFNGQQADLEVVGIGRSPRDLSGELRRTDPTALASPGFLAAHSVGAWPPVVTVRLDDTERDLDDVVELVSASRSQGDSDSFYRAPFTTAADEYVDTIRGSIDGLTAGLLVFALVAAAAGTLATAQAAGREARASSGVAATLSAHGMERRDRTLAVALPLVVAGLVGVFTGAVAAVAVSPVLPRGRARSAEIDPGVWVDPFVLGAGALVLFVLVAAVALLATGRAAGRRRPVDVTGRSALVGRSITALGLGPAVSIGLRRASPTRESRCFATARSAMTGVAVAVAGVLAAGVVVQSADALRSDPANWGWVWTTRPDAFSDGEEMAAVVADPDVVAAGLLSVGNAVVGASGMQGMSLTAHKGDLAFTLLRGRLPSSAAEVALGSQTLDDLGLDVGDSVEALLSDGETTVVLQIVGTAVLPQTEVATLDEGAVFTPEGLERVSPDADGTQPVLRYRDGADVEALERRLTETTGLAFPVFSRARPPGAVTNVVQSSGIARALAGFFLAIGAIGLLNALATSIRRDGPEFGVLRALGFRRRQIRQVTFVQALTLSAVGVAVGVPLGLIAGRAAWRSLSGGLGAAAEPQVPWSLIVAVVPVTAAVTALLTWWPARAAGRGRAADQLRAQ